MSTLATILLLCCALPQQSIGKRPVGDLQHAMICDTAEQISKAPSEYVLAWNGKNRVCVPLPEDDDITQMKKDIITLTEVNRVLMEQVADLQRQIDEIAQSVDDNRNRISALEARKGE